MIFPAPRLDALTDVLDYLRQSVCSDVWVCVDKDLRTRAEVHELIEDFPDVPPLGRAGEEFAVRECAGSTFTVAEIGLRVQNSLTGKFRHVELAVTHILSPFEDNWLEAESQELECGEHSGRTGSDDDHRFGVGDILIFRDFVRDVGLKAVVVALDAVAIDHIVARVNRTFGDHAGSVGVREGRLVGLCRVYHVDHGVATEVHLSRRDDPHVIRPKVSAYSACHFKFDHILFLKTDSTTTNKFINIQNQQYTFNPQSLRDSP